MPGCWAKLSFGRRVRSNRREIGLSDHLSDAGQPAGGCCGSNRPAMKPGITRRRRRIMNASEGVTMKPITNADNARQSTAQQPRGACLLERRLPAQHIGSATAGSATAGSATAAAPRLAAPRLAAPRWRRRCWWRYC